MASCGSPSEPEYGRLQTSNMGLSGWRQEVPGTPSAVVGDSMVVGVSAILRVIRSPRNKDPDRNLDVSTGWIWLAEGRRLLRRITASAGAAQFVNTFL